MREDVYSITIIALHNCDAFFATLMVIASPTTFVFNFLSDANWQPLKRFWRIVPTAQKPESFRAFSRSTEVKKVVKVNFEIFVLFEVSEKPQENIPWYTV